MEQESSPVLLAMTPVIFKHLDIPIIRSCNLACRGCITHSDHKNIHGVVRLEESQDWLVYWGQRLAPQHVTLFGGEPLLHPEFADWFTAVSHHWPNTNIGVNTNGYYLKNLYPYFSQLFTQSSKLSLIVSVQNNNEPYLTDVLDGIEDFKQKLVDYYVTLPGVTATHWNLWLDETENNQKQWWVLLYNTDQQRDCNTGIGLTVCQQYLLPWTRHYTGHGELMRPTYEYQDSWYKENHQYCQARQFITLYRGRIYKCPPVGVLEHSLTTFDLTEHSDWKTYLDNYQSLGQDQTDSGIVQWFEQQSQPEMICNMCGYAGPSGSVITPEERSHQLKNYWNYKISSAK